MNITQAKQLRMKDVLAALGCQPHHEAKGEIWYPSPFRHESEPSFKINLDRNIWYDFGEGEGGNILDFAMKYYATDLKGALRQLAALNIGTLLQPVTRPATVPKRAATKPLPLEVTDDGLAVTSIKPLGNRALVQYLEKRGIPLDVAKEYVQEIYYTRQGKPYFALAFANNSGGYELRNPYFKGVYGAKDITLVKKEKGIERVAVFEGFMDMLSARHVYAKEMEDAAQLVMNSVALREKAVAVIQEMNVVTVRLFADRDSSGQELVIYFQERLPGITVTDESERYAGHKDLNEWLQAQQGRGR